MWGAGLLIRKANLFGGTCARVCPAEVLCEKGCRDRGMAWPIAIAALQRFACDATIQAAARVLPPAGTRRGRVAVVGAGPAGLAAAVELARLGVRAVVYEEKERPGGMLAAIPPYRLPRRVWEEEVRLASSSVELCLGRAVALEDLDGLLAEHDAVILAAGMGEPQGLEIPGTELEGVWQALPLLVQVQQGARPRFSGRVAVVGGGNVAIDAACTVLRLGAEEAVVVYRRQKADMPAWPSEVAEAEEEGVQFAWRQAPVRILGEGGRVVGLEVQETRPGEPDASGRCRPVAVPGTERVLPVQAVVLAVGQRRQRVPAGLTWDGDVRTSHPRVFVAGDLASGGATVVQAVGEGKRAAQAVWQLLG